MPSLCLSGCMFRDGRPSIFLRDLRVPAERCDDEPVLHLWFLPQVPLLLPSDALMIIRKEGMHCYGPSHLSTVSCQSYREKLICSLPPVSVKNMGLKNLMTFLNLSVVLCPSYRASLHFFSSSGSRLGGIVTTMCFFFNHGEVSAQLVLLSVSE